jgi:uncharacterized membrane protein
MGRKTHDPGIMDAEPIPLSDPDPTIFDAVLHPHRSLGRGGFLVLMVCVSMVGFVTGIVFLIAGAWPVFGFMGLDVALIYVPFRLNYRSGRQMERVRLTVERLEIERISASGRIMRWSFQPYWVHVELHEPEEHHSRLTLRSHGRELTVGKFLTPSERATLCSALNTALDRCRATAQPTG